jgi:hypothetical protein
VIIVCSYLEIHARTRKFTKNDNAAIYLRSRKNAFLYIFKVATWMIYHPLDFLTIVLCYFLSYGPSLFSVELEGNKVIAFIALANSNHHFN